MLRILEERGFPVSELRPLASSRSTGRQLDYLGKPVHVETLTEDAFDGIHIALFSAGGDRSRTFAPAAVEAGAVVIDNSSAFRMDPAVPLVVPEVNERDLESHRGIVANPNCVAAPLVVALKPIADAAGLERVVVSSYQSVSGTGAAAIEELITQSRGNLEGKEPAPSVYPRPIAFNVLPHIDTFDDSGYTGEEVVQSHSSAVHIETTDKLSAQHVRELLMGAPGVVLQDDPQHGVYPLPRDATGSDEVFVGRIREDASHPRGIALWVVSDNLRKGAATNAVQIAESLVTKGWL